MFLRQSFVNLLTLFATVCTLFLTSGLYAGTSLNSLAIANNFPDAVTGFEFPDEPREWLLIGTAPGSFGTTVSVNSGFELGAHLPLDGAIPTSGGGQGPDLSSVTKPTGAADPSRTALRAIPVLPATSPAGVRRFISILMVRKCSNQFSP